MKLYDRIIIGAGFYGLYAALQLGKRGLKTLVLECDNAPFSRASHLNQARVHMGYHYPRSLSTAKKSRDYFDRFVQDFRFCIHASFDKIYATSENLGWTNASQFVKFCRDADIYYAPVHVEQYFKPNMCDGAFLTTEYAYDAALLREHMLAQIKTCPNVEIKCNAAVQRIAKTRTHYQLTTISGETYASDFVLNATYASINQVLAMAGFAPFPVKYELCEIILCQAKDALVGKGITVMDGPFFSIMPFGKTGLHSLTSVTFTPHLTSTHTAPDFSCQKNCACELGCKPAHLANCNTCNTQPNSAWPYMQGLAKKYLRDELAFEYQSSLFCVKPILNTSEIDDSRPTVMKKHSDGPVFISVLSGKINTVYDLDEVLS